MKIHTYEFGIRQCLKNFVPVGFILICLPFSGLFQCLLPIPVFCLTVVSVAKII